jgi:hypothetical protein
LSSNHPFVINLEQKNPNILIKSLAIIGTFFAAKLARAMNNLLKGEGK